MNLWNSMKNSQMANNIVKWWRTKFLNGYKQFAVECSDGKVSDTEELLERLNSEDNTNDRLRADCTTPPIQNFRDLPVSPPAPTISTEPPSSLPQEKETPHHHLNLEEFSCDVSVENGEQKTGQERQEFSFTLYDFDGHGKITKDDIAGLVTTIYEALGSSVKVPHYGSKTIKVKLTVSPDQRKHVSATVIDQKEDENNSESEVRYKRDLNVTIRQGSKENHRHHRRQKKTKPSRSHHCCKRHEEVVEEKNICVSDESDACSRVSESSDDEEEGECSDVEVKQNIKHRKYTNPKSRYTIPNLFINDSNICSQQETCHKTKRLKKRSGSLQRQELLEIIQANMDKNNLNFQTSRKPCPTTPISTENKQLQSASETKQQKHSYKANKMTTPLQYLANMVDPTHFYVDLASLQNTTGLPQRCNYDKIIDAVMCVSNKKVALATKQNKCRRHKHAKTVDLSHLPIRYQLLDYSLGNEENITNKPIIKRIQKRSESELNKRNFKKCPEVVIGQASNLHHLKHKNRQEDQARSMAQVVNWLEQEFSSTRLKEKPQPKTKGTFNNNQDKTGSTPASATPSNVERHEHHHVHEHIHHHYHHYQEAPIVV